jgi:hypothetical protein
MSDPNIYSREPHLGDDPMPDPNFVEPGVRKGAPAIGQIILFNPGVHETVMTSDQPLAAIVTYVHKNGTVNLAVFGKNGDQWQKHSIKMLADDEAYPERISYAKLPSHKGPAKEAEKAHVADLPRLPGENDEAYKARNDANRKQVEETEAAKKKNPAPWPFNPAPPANVPPANPIPAPNTPMQY